MTCGLRAQQYRNPIIPGFHPDPSICRVGDDFYLVNSSFQYFPGVPIFHSRDLIHWEQIGNVLTRDSQLPLKGATSWLGIYAPTLRYHDGTYYMITTNVGNGGNFIVTATDPRGTWSEPIWLEQQGIDPSLYFEDGKCYMVSNPDNTIMLCELDVKTGKQLTPSMPLWRGTGGRYPEGPHIYKKDGYYYLLISEGGTELAHKLTIARSKNIYGPYESNPANPILTNCNLVGQTMQIQGTGHGDFVQAGDGSWWMAFLAYRNYGGSYHHLGRETCLVPVEWKAGEWPVVNGGKPVDTLVTARLLPQVAMSGLADGNIAWPQARSGKNDADAFRPEWICIQNPIDANYRFRNGRLTLRAHGTLTRNGRPTFFGARQCNAAIMAETMIDLTTLSPTPSVSDEPPRCGLSVYQMHDGHLDLYTDGKRVGVAARLKSVLADCTYSGIDTALPAGAKQLRLRVTADGEMYRFFYAVDDGKYREIAAQNCSLVSTEVVGGFTGVVIGMYVEGLSADFLDFRLTNK